MVLRVALRDLFVPTKGHAPIEDVKRPLMALGKGGFGVAGQIQSVQPTLASESYLIRSESPNTTGCKTNLHIEHSQRNFYGGASKREAPNGSAAFL